MSRSAFLFPGQGSQAVGMLKELAASHMQVMATFAEASEVLGFDLWELSQQGPSEELNRTENTQPALLAAGVACWRIWVDNGGARPDYLAGHSLGEYTALVCADVLAFSDAIKLVARRGQLMQSAVPEGQGAMAAILGLDDDQVAAQCDQARGDGIVSPANFNAPGQVVIAGQTNAVERAIEACKTAGARRAMLLPVSVPSHCELMQAAADKLAEAFTSIDWCTPTIPVIHNVDVALHSEPDSIMTALQAQLHQPVRWSDCVLWLQSNGVTSYAECGPGKVLSGLLKRIGNGRGAEFLSIT